MSNDTPTLRQEPLPVPGCTVCAGWARIREEHRRVHDYSGVVDCNVLIRRHRGIDDHQKGPNPEPQP